MALTRLSDFLDGTALTETEITAEIDQILNQSNTLISPFTGNVDINLKILSNWVIERLSSDPGTATAGRIFQLSTNNKIRIGDGTNWANAVGGVLQTISFGAACGTVARNMLANGVADASIVVSGTTTKHGVIAGTMQQMTFFHTGDLSSNNATMKIHVDGVVQKTLTASAAANSVDVFSSMAIAVTDTDVIEVEYDASGGTDPGDSMVTITIE